jgi:uncharacterized membrane protein
MQFALFNQNGVYFVLRWLHFFFGITWIGLLYYFNFVQGAFFAETDPATKSKAIQQLVPRALWWFRWGAMGTFLSGWIYLGMKGGESPLIFASSWGVAILTGAVFGSLMWFNVWFVIWPSQKQIIASAQAVAAGGQANPGVAALGAKAGLASRHNTLFSIPLLFLMAAASHLPIQINPDRSLVPLVVVLAAIIGALELNALKGKLGPITTVKGVIHMGFLLAIVIYLIIELMTK